MTVTTMQSMTGFIIAPISLHYFFFFFVLSSFSLLEKTFLLLSMLKLVSEPTHPRIMTAWVYDSLPCSFSLTTSNRLLTGVSLVLRIPRFSVLMQPSAVKYLCRRAVVRSLIIMTTD